MSRVGAARGGPIARFAAWYSRRSLGQVPDSLAITAHHPGILRGYVAYEWELGRARRVDLKLKELAAVKAAAIVGCAYCLDIGSAEARKAGVSREQLTDLPVYRDSEHFDEVERLVLDYATAMTSNPCSVPDELVASLRAHFDDAQLVELTALIAFENYRARFNRALDVESQNFCRGACAVAEPAAAVSSSG